MITPTLEKKNPQFHLLRVVILLEYNVMNLLFVGTAFAEKLGVNKPELLPKEFTTVIDVAGFLSDGQV